MPWPSPCSSRSTAAEVMRPLTAPNSTCRASSGGDCGSGYARCNAARIATVFLDALYATHCRQRCHLLNFTEEEALVLSPMSAHCTQSVQPRCHLKPCVLCFPDQFETSSMPAECLSYVQCSRRCCLAVRVCLQCMFRQSLIANTEIDANKTFRHESKTFCHESNTKAEAAATYVALMAPLEYSGNDRTGWLGTIVDRQADSEGCESRCQTGKVCLLVMSDFR